MKNKIQCPHCQAIDIAAGTPSKTALARPELNKTDFIKHLVAKHQIAPLVARDLFKRLVTPLALPALPANKANK